MNSRSSPDPSARLRRCRPLLGTFVEITVTGLDAARRAAAVDAAFTTLTRVQNRMSVHDPASELSHVNATAAQQPVPVSAETFLVLQRGLALAQASEGAFDFTIAPLLARWGLRPATLRRRAAGDWRDVELLPRRRVRFARPLALDLGGVAKGFAVDAAITTLREAGVASALVNAGGDLRAFGAEPLSIHLRHPQQPHQLPHTITLHEAALATSSPCFTERGWRGQRVSHLVHAPSQRAVTGGFSVSVRAAECWLADALTKVVMNAPDRAEAILAHHHAEAFLLAA